jgi:hypothetical protein
MRVGRPPMGAEQVENLEGSANEKARLRVMLETFSGELSVTDACRELGMRRSRFHELRVKALQGALEGLAPGIPGRPRKDRGLHRARELELERQVAELELALVTERTRAEIAMVMPHLLREPERATQKGAREMTRSRAKRRSRRASRGITRG